MQADNALRGRRAASCFIDDLHLHDGDREERRNREWSVSYKTRLGPLTLCFSIDENKKKEASTILRYVPKRKKKIKIKIDAIIVKIFKCKHISIRG